MNAEQLKAIINKTLTAKQLDLLLDLVIIHKYSLQDQISQAQTDIHKYTQILDSQKLGYSTDLLADLIDQHKNNNKLIAELSHAKNTLLVNTEAILTIKETEEQTQ